MKKRNGQWIAAGGVTAVLILSLFLGGCGVKEAIFSGGREQKEYGKAETMMIVTSERLRYEELYTSQIWTAAVDNRGTTFESSLLSQIHEFLKELKIMSLMAEENELTLSGQEQEAVRAAADAYLAALGGGGAEALGLEEKTAEEFYEDYRLANKLVDQLTEGADLEVSDSEARVITVEEIETSDAETAAAALAAIQAEGGSFQAAAKEYSEKPLEEIRIYRGQRGTAYESAAFDLTAGGVSGVVEENGKYYVILCVNDYDEAATQERKEWMVRQRKNETFYNAYQEFKTELLLTGDDALWEEIRISDSPQVSADFFAVYEEAFGSL